MLYIACLGPLARADAAELLWSPDRMQSVRQELRQLRLLPGAESWLSAGDPLTVTALADVTAFEAACRDGEYATAISLYVGPLLEGFRVKSAPAFTDWLESERERLEEMLLNALQAESARLEGLLQYGEALDVARRLLQQDPLDETSYRNIMRLYYKQGDMAAALAMFDECRRVLARELGAEPHPDTLGLHEFIRDEDLRQAGARRAAVNGLALHLARALALLDTEVTLGVLARALDASELEVANCISQLKDAGYLDGRRLAAATAGRLREELPPSVELHLESRLAAALAAAGSAPEVVARHLLRSPERAAAVPYLRAAAVAAEDALDQESALRLLQQAAEVAADRRERVETLLEVERVAVQLGRAEARDEALDTALHEARLLQDDYWLIEVDFRHIHRLLQAGDPTSAAIMAEDTVAAARRIQRTELLSRALLMLGGAHFHAGQLPDALAAFRETLGVAADTEKLRALNNVALVLGMQGEYAESLSHLEEALTIARKQGKRELVAGLLNNIGATAERMARYDLAVRRFEEAAALSRDLGHNQTEATTILNVVDIRLKQGKLDDCSAILAAAAAIADQTLGNDRLRVRVGTLQGILAQKHGQMAQAIAHLAQALELAASLGDNRLSAVITYNLEFTRLLSGDAGNQVTTAVDALESLGVNDVLPWVYAELGQVAPDAATARHWAMKMSAHASNDRLAELKQEVLQRAAASEMST